MYTTTSPARESLGLFIGSPGRVGEGRDLGEGLCGEPIQAPHFSEKGRLRRRITGRTVGLPRLTAGQETVGTDSEAQQLDIYQANQL